MTIIRRLAAFACAMSISWAAPAGAQTGDPAAPPAARSSSFELRIQTSSNLGGGGSLLGLILAPGLTYETDGENLSFNLSGGAGIFLSPAIAVGADLGITIFNTGDDETLKVISFVPYLKYVTGMAAHESGFFIEPSVGVSVVDFGGDSVTIMQLGAWGGGHFFLGKSSTAFLVGPFVNYLKNTDADDADTILLGVRFGVSTYLL